MAIWDRKRIEIHLPSGPVNFSFHLPVLKHYFPKWQPVWRSEDKHKQSILAFLTNPFQPNGLKFRSSFRLEVFIYQAEILFRLKTTAQV